jgi:sigma-B regulation protein RsbU (phosphoserine phosphatase)
MPGQFVSLLYGELDAEGNLIYGNAGHHPPLVLDRAGGARTLPGSGPVLGVRGLELPPHRRVIDRLAPGDTLVLYTDGVVEAMDAAGEELGLERLCVWLTELTAAGTRSCEEILDVVLARVDRFTGRRQRSDDQTLLILRRA